MKFFQNVKIFDKHQKILLRSSTPTPTVCGDMSSCRGSGVLPAGWVGGLSPWGQRGPSLMGSELHLNPTNLQLFCFH